MAGTFNLYDRVIGLAIKYRDPSQDNDSTVGYKIFHIPSTTSGNKPNISIHWKRVPGQFSYDAEITVKNLNIPFNAIWSEEIQVSVGYVNMVSLFTFEVFAAYQSEPGPDSSTTFHCLTGSAGLGLLAEQPYTLSIYNGTTPWTIRDVLLEVQRQLQERGGKDNFSIRFVPKYNKSKKLNEYLDMPFTDKDMEVKTFDNGYALLNYIQNCIARKLQPYQVNVVTVYFNKVCVFAFIDAKDGKVHITSSAGKLTDADYSDEAIPVLDAVTAAYWNAGTLTIEAPFNPFITPGKLFKISPRYYTGGIALPNSVARMGQHRDATDIYWVITQEVVFSTYDENKMTLMAVPMSNSPAANQYYKAETNAKMSEDEKKFALNVIYSPVVIQLGARTKTEKVDSIEELTLNLSSTRNHKIKTNDTLSTVAKDYNLPDLVGHKPGSKTSELVPGYVAWYPVIMVLTYTQYKSTKDEQWKINLANPDAIVTDRFLSIPSATSWQDIKQNSSQCDSILNIYDVCATFYEVKGLTSWAANLRKAYRILKEDILDE